MMLMTHAPIPWCCPSTHIQMSFGEEPKILSYPLAEEEEEEAEDYVVLSKFRFRQAVDVPVISLTKEAANLRRGWFDVHVYDGGADPVAFVRKAKTATSLAKYVADSTLMPYHVVPRTLRHVPPFEAVLDVCDEDTFSVRFCCSALLRAAAYDDFYGCVTVFARDIEAAKAIAAVTPLAVVPIKAREQACTHAWLRWVPELNTLRLDVELRSSQRPEQRHSSIPPDSPPAKREAMQMETVRLALDVVETA
jgi:hypothetical protein